MEMGVGLSAVEALGRQTVFSLDGILLLGERILPLLAIEPSKQRNGRIHSWIIIC